MTKRILITGGAGFIGSHLAHHFSADSDTTVLDNLRSGNAHNLDGINCRFIFGSILDDSTLRHAVKGVEEIYHLAAMISVPESIEKPDECSLMNIEGTRRILDIAITEGVRKVVLASSAAIYGDNPILPKIESMVPEPKSPYAQTKLAGELLLEDYRTRYDLETASLRFFNVFGPRQDPKSHYAAAIPNFITKALRNEPIIIYGDGMQTRDFIHVSDVAKALAYIGGAKNITGTFNVGYGQSLPILEIAGEIIRLTSSSSIINHMPTRAGDVRHSCASIERLLTSGWKPKTTLFRGLADTIAAYKKFMV